MKKNFIHQTEENDCGYAAAGMIINSLQNHSLCIDELKYKYQFESDMLSIENIEQILGDYYISVDVYQCKIDEISICQNEPLILFTHNENGPHFVVCYAIKNKKFLIADPGKIDYHWVDLQEMNNSFAGICIVTKKISNYRAPKIFLKFVDKKIFSFWKGYLMITSFSFILNIGLIMSSNFSKFYFNNVMNENKNFMLLFFVAFGLVFLLTCVMELIINFFENKLQRKIKITLLIDFLERFQNLSADYFEEIPLERWTAKMDSLNFYIQSRLIIFLNFPAKFLLFGFSILALAKINMTFFIFSLVQNIALAFLSYYFSFVLKKINFNEQNARLKNVTLLNDIFYGHEAIQAKNLGSVFKTKCANEFKAYETKNDLNETKNNLVAITFRIISQLCYYFLSYFCLSKIQAGSIFLGDLIYYFSINTYVNQFFSLLMQIIKNKNATIMHAGEIRFLYETKNIENNLPENFTIKSIALEDVTKIREGQKLFCPITKYFKNHLLLFGPSGVGKSTILKIISGAYKNFEGSVFLNEYNISRFSQKLLAEKIFYLGQYDYLFNDSVFENIKMFSKISLEDFNKYGIFEILQNHNIQLEKKLRNNGANLSKGQRQIINFIATFFIKRDVFIIDESLSNVDEKTAKELFSLFLKIHQNSIVIFCTHNIIWRRWFRDQLEVKPWSTMQ